MNGLNWIVAYKFRASESEPECEKIVAAFDWLVSAEDFINLVIPAETRDRFYIKHA